MTTPNVHELPRRLEPITPDPFVREALAPVISPMEVTLQIPPAVLGVQVK